MPIMTATRLATTDEIAAEMDRRGTVIKALEAKLAELTRANELLEQSVNRAREAGHRDAGLWNSAGLSLLYAIRAAIGWNDKTSLDLLPRECARLYEVGFRDAIALAGAKVDQAATAASKVRTPTADTFLSRLAELRTEILLIPLPARNGE